MAVSNYSELLPHVGHALECVTYGTDNVVIECITCCEVLCDYTDVAGDPDRCACGASLDDGEGYDGRCGSCADRAELGLCDESH